MQIRVEKTMVEKSEELARQHRTLFEIADDLVTAFDSLDLCTTDAERAEVQAMIDRAGAEIMAKADRTAGVLRRMEAEIELCAKEEERLTARRIRIEQGRDWLKSYVLNVMRDKGLGKIKGDTVTLRVQPNGGKLPVVIDDPEQVPDELCWMEGKVKADLWRLMWRCCAREGFVIHQAEFMLKRSPAKELIAERLQQSCSDCDGDGVAESGVDGTLDTPRERPCPTCQGTGRKRVPGAHLAERSSHLRIL